MTSKAISTHSISTTKNEFRNIYYRLSQTQVGGGRLGQVMAFLKRSLKVWGELAPGEPQEIIDAIPPTEKRVLTATAEEMSAIADSLLRLLNSDAIMDATGAMVPNVTGTKIAIMADAKLINPDLEGYLLRRLKKEPVEPFTPDIEDDESGESAEKTE